ncbi:PepSY domain-containing protein [Marinobacteraceae bacterium S3BR75-40.1]
MLRRLHSLPGLIAGLLLIVLATSGAILALSPALDRAQTVLPESGQVNVAQLAQRVVAHYPGTEQIQRTPSGTVIVYYSQGRRPDAVRVDPTSGEAIGPYRPSPVFRWVKDLHRSFMLGDGGRLAAGIGAAIMVLLCVSGILMLVRRMGGWRHLLRPIRGTTSQRLHGELARFAVLGLLLSALTGSYMSAVRFGLLPEATQAEPPFPAQVTGGAPAPVGELSALRATDLGDLRELVFPYPGDPNDVYSLRTDQGAGFVDQSSGALLAFEPRQPDSALQSLIIKLHTGEGLWWLGLILGASALTVPVLSVTGGLIWWRRRRALPRLRNNSSARNGETVILVGSQGNTTWGFARSLHEALTEAGHRVHTAPMSRLEPDYPRAQRLLVLTATYGEGEAPESARGFHKRLGRMTQSNALPYAVLGFGDRQFPRFCQYAREVSDALSEKGWPQLLPTEFVDRQSSQTFHRWAEALGEHLGIALDVNHQPARPHTQSLELAAREDYGQAVGAPTSVLRFRLPEGRRRLLGGRRMPAFEAGDLLGVLPPGSEHPRFYSLASASRDGFAEICVRQHPGGLCSGFLHQLAPGDRVDVFIQRNPEFRPHAGKAPVVLIGAGTGIGPLAGFIRHNRARNPMYLYWGGRSPQSDFLYRDQLHHYLSDHRLHALNTAFSRVEAGSYVQDRVTADASRLRQLVEAGAQILVCGGRDMAASVMAALDDILAPLQLDVSTLKAEGRYREDVY